MKSVFLSITLVAIGCEKSTLFSIESAPNTAMNIFTLRYGVEKVKKVTMNIAKKTNRLIITCLGKT